MTQSCVSDARASARASHRQLQRSDNGLVVLYADLDGLKGINDSLGHLEGDRALMRTAEVLKEAFRSSDIIARLGGDEFVLLASVGADETPESLTDRLRQKIALANSQRNRPYDLSISIGVAHYDPDEACTIEELMGRADRVMYEEKRKKRTLQPVKLSLESRQIEAVA